MSRPLPLFRFSRRDIIALCEIYNNKFSIIQQAKSGEGGIYAALPLPYEGRETISDRLSTHAKHNNNNV